MQYGEGLLPLLRVRRSIRRFQSRPVEKGKVDLLLEALLRSPSSRGLQPWEFIVVTDPGVLEDLARAKAHGSSFLAGAPLAVAIVADPETCDVWIEDGSIAAIILQLAAQSLGLGSCWVQIRRRKRDDGTSSEEHVRGVLRLPDGHRVLAVVGIGYPDETKSGHPTADLPFGKLHWESYGK